MGAQWAKTFIAALNPVQIFTAEISSETDLATELSDDLPMISSP
jgi:hypothetical protein